jgi:hypothetical protein
MQASLLDDLLSMNKSDFLFVKPPGNLPGWPWQQHIQSRKQLLHAGRSWAKPQNIWTYAQAPAC